MVFALVLAAVTTGADTDYTIDKNVLTEISPKLKLAITGDGHTLDKTKFDLLEKKDRMVTCPYGYFTNKTAYETNVAENRIRVEARKPDSGKEIVVDCHVKCKDDTAGLVAEPRWGNSYTCTNDATKSYCEVEGTKTNTQIYICDPTDDDGKVIIKHCPFSSGTCTKVAIGPVISTLPEEGDRHHGESCKSDVGTLKTEKCVNAEYCSGDGNTDETCKTRVPDFLACTAGESCQLKSECKESNAAGEAGKKQCVPSKAFSYGFTVLAVLAAFVL